MSTTRVADETKQSDVRVVVVVVVIVVAAAAVAAACSKQEGCGLCRCLHAVAAIAAADSRHLDGRRRTLIFVRRKLPL